MLLNSNFEPNCEDGLHDLSAQFFNSQSFAQEPIATVRTKRNSEVLARSREATRIATKALHEKLALLIALEPHRYAGLNPRLALEFRPKSKPGASKVLLALIDLVLTPRGATMTQTECRTRVQQSYPEHGMYKDWTKPLPKWARAHVEKRAASNPVPLAIRIGSKTSLRDIHNAAKAMFAGASGEGLVFNATIIVHTDSVLINGTRFKLNTNKSNGKEYSTLRVNRSTLLSVLQ